MKVTVCQHTPDLQDIDTFLTEIAQHVKANESDFLLLPEMNFYEWLAADPIPDSQQWHNAVKAHSDRLADLPSVGAKGIMGSRPIINDAGSWRNQAYIWTPENPIAAPVHEKYYLPDEPGFYEHQWYERGDKSFDVCRALGMRIGVQICTEMWFFEWARHYARSRADLLCIPRATPHSEKDAWLAGGRTAAISSGAYCLSSNLWMPEGAKPDLAGVAWVIDPDGNVLATTDEDTPFATVEIDLEYARNSKSTYPRYVPE